MKKLPFVFLITMPILQIVLAALKLFGVFGEDVRWLWVLTPVWLLVLGFALYGMYISIKQGSERNAAGEHERRKERRRK